MMTLCMALVVKPEIALLMHCMSLVSISSTAGIAGLLAWNNTAITDEYESSLGHLDAPLKAAVVLGLSAANAVPSNDPDIDIYEEYRPMNIRLGQVGQVKILYPPKIIFSGRIKEINEKIRLEMLKISKKSDDEHLFAPASEDPLSLQALITLGYSREPITRSREYTLLFRELITSIFELPSVHKRACGELC